MRKLNLTALLALTFIAQAGYGSGDDLGIETHPAAASGFSGGASSTDSFRCANYWINMISGFLMEDYQGLNILPEGEWEDLLRDPRLISVEHNRGLVTTASKKTNLGVLGVRPKWRYNKKVEEFITSYFAPGTRDDAALMDQLSEIRPDDDATVMRVLDNYSVSHTGDSVEEKTAFMNTLLSIPPQDLRTFFDGMGDFFRTLIIKAFGALNKPQREAFMHYAETLFEGEIYDGHWRVEVIKAAGLLSVEQIHAIGENAETVFAGLIYGYQRAEIIRELKKLTPEEIRARASSGAASSRK